MTPNILVTGGTGTLGRLVVPLLAASAAKAGGRIHILSRSAMGEREGVAITTGDLMHDVGIDAAVAGVHTVLHLAGNQKGDPQMARNLLRAAKSAGVQHIVYISVVGAERVPVRSAVDRAMFGYFGAKRDAELLFEESGIGWTTLRATQFHDLVWMTARALTKSPIVPVPAGARFQPIEAAEVAQRLVELTMAAPAGLVPELAGPTVYPMGDLVRSYLRAIAAHRLLIPMPIGGGAAKAIKHGANLAPDRAVGRRRWEEFLADRVALPA